MRLNARSQNSECRFWLLAPSCLCVQPLRADQVVSAPRWDVRAFISLAPSGLPRPVQASHPLVALYPPRWPLASLLPLTMSWKDPPLMTGLLYRSGLMNPTDFLNC